MFKRPFGAGYAAVIAAGAAIASASRVLWQVEPMETTHYRGRKYRTGRAHGFNYGKLYEPHGQRECERRMRQIELGQLKAENGLVT